MNKGHLKTSHRHFYFLKVPITKQPLIIRTHQFLNWSSSGSSDGDREQIFKATIDADKIGSSGESEAPHMDKEEVEPTQKVKGKVTLQTCNLSFKANDHRSNTTKYHWMAAEEERITVPKDLHWVAPNPERTKNSELNGNKSDGKLKMMKNVTEEGSGDSRVSTASSLPPSDPFTPRNLTQYDVIIGQMRYPIHVHR